MEEKYLGKPSVHIISPYESIAEGRGTRNIALAKLIGDNHECTLVCTRFSHGKKTILDKSLYKNNSNFRVSTLFTIKYSKNLSIRRMLAHWVTAFSLVIYLVRNTKSNDKVLVSSIPPEVLFVTMLLGKLKNLDVTLDVRDIWPDAFPSKGIIGSLFKVYCKVLYKIAFGLKSIKVIYVAPSFKNWINSYIPSSKITKCTFGFLGYDKERWEGLKSKNTKKEKIRLVYIGYLESQFDLENVLINVKDNSKFELVIIGNGSKLNYYQNLAQNCDRITFLGLLPPEIAAQEVFSCDIGILPISHTAQMPNKLFDYIGASLPILAIGESDSAKFILQKKLGWFTNNSESCVAHALSQVTFSDIANFKSNIIKCRCEFSKGASYNRIIQSILD